MFNFHNLLKESQQKKLAAERSTYFKPNEYLWDTKQEYVV